MKIFLPALLLFCLNLKSQKLIIDCDTMFKVRYSDDLRFHEGVEKEQYEVLKFKRKSPKIVIDFKNETVRIGNKKYKIFCVLEDNYPLYYIDLERKKDSYELFVFDGCGTIGVFLKYYSDNEIIGLYFQNVQVSKLQTN